jgi:HD-GYP domain-containing protein (c-di-GMP phosphodiesterase class II)
MRKQITVDQLQVGMFVDALDGSWLDHPFWKSAFKIEQASQLAQLRTSKVRTLWIDTSKGLDVPSVAPRAEVVDDCELPASPAGAPAPDARLIESARAQPPVVTVSLQEEVTRARRILGQARGAMTSMFNDVRLGKAVDTEHCLPLVNEITQSVGRNPGAIVSLARLKTSDDYTYLHSVAVCALMVSLAKQLGLNDEDTREAGMAGLVHDLGKAMMPLEVLNKPGKLTDAEFTIMKSHPEAGHRMLEEAKGVGPVPLDVCLHHHEKVNGTGYPHRLKGEAISIFSRMGAVCDVYDAITSNRPYKAGWDPAESVQKMAQWAKEGHFDERVFQAFVKSIGIFPTGSLVKLQSGKLAVVVEQGSSSLLQPLVRVFYSTKSRQPITPEMLDLSKSIDQIVSRESPQTWGFPHIDQLWTGQA